MTFKIALKNGVYYGCGVGEEVVFSDASLTIETYTDEASFNARLDQVNP